MTKISKQTKLEAILAYHAGFASKAQVAKHYGIAKGPFSMLLAAYATHGPDVLFNPPEITGEFRIAVASWAIRENASLTAVAAKFGYVGMAQIVKWKEIYSKLGSNGLLSIQKRRKPKMTKKKQNQPNKLSAEENWLA